MPQANAGSLSEAKKEPSYGIARFKYTQSCVA